MQKGRIQVSQSTADLLKAAGKQQWLTAREDLVEAKGKGKMQTYWVDIISTSDRGSAMTGSAAESRSTTSDRGRAITGSAVELRSTNGRDIVTNQHQDIVRDIGFRSEVYDFELDV